MEISQLETDLLPSPMDFRVYLPPCYDDQPERLYPVLYLIHGQSFNDDQWDRLGVDETLDTLIAAGELPPFLVVMPRDTLWKEPGDDPFGQIVIEELLPWIDHQYRTLPDRAYRAVGGLSRGAAWALHLGLTNWHDFGAIGMHSGFVFHSDVYSILSWLDAIPSNLLPRFYMDLSDNDRPGIIDSAVWFENELTDRTIPHTWQIFPGYHEEAYWQAHVEDYLRWYAEAWPRQFLPGDPLLPTSTP